MTKHEKLNLLSQVFSPVTPVKKQDLFFGRKEQLQSVCDAINEPGQHAILYGERGVGKTSLSNIMTTHVTNVYAVKTTCTRDDDFRSLWQRALEKVVSSKTTTGIGFQPEEQTRLISLAQAIQNDQDLLPSQVEVMLSTVGGSKLLFIFDEFDNIYKEQTRKQFADLIKTLSDNSNTVTIVIVGISDNVVNLIGNHQSLERCLMQIQMPRMSPLELGAIIDNGIKKLELKIRPDVRKRIIDFSTGFPHYTHLLAKYGCKAVVESDKAVFNEKHLDESINHALKNAQEQIKESYRTATFSSSEKSQWESVLFACASADVDEYNCFTTSDVVTQFCLLVMKKRNEVNITYNLGKLCQSERSEILEKIAVDGNVKYRFTNPLSKAYVRLRMTRV